MRLNSGHNLWNGTSSVRNFGFMSSRQPSHFQGCESLWDSYRWETNVIEPRSQSRSGRRHAVREDRLEQAHLQDMAYRQIPLAGLVNPYDIGSGGG